MIDEIKLNQQNKTRRIGSSMLFLLPVVDLQVLVEFFSTPEVSPQLCCLRVDHFVFFQPLEQLIPRPEELFLYDRELWSL